MKLRLLFLALLAAGCCRVSVEPATRDLTGQWDTVKVIANPDKGWYHHMLDNGVHKYLLEDDSVLERFPGMDHLYLRLCWAFLEPQEGVYDWHYIDDIVEKYVPLGYGISFRISCKETGMAPGSVPYEVDGVGYATPYWVKEAGAKGVDRPQYGTPNWTPEWDDPVFMEKLTNFHKAFAAKYDGKPWVRYIDIGSLGDWGEGHTYSCTRIPITVAQMKQHISMYLDCYKKSPLVVSDDLIANADKEGKEEEMLDYVLSNGISLRDDSPMVDGYMKNDLATWTVRHPHYFEKCLDRFPIVFELEHYGKVKKFGYWFGQDGRDMIPGLGVSGAEVFTNALKTMHATYIGYHGYMDEWLSDNPVLTGELLNLCGYWYFPASVDVTCYHGGKLDFCIAWANRGVSPAYNPYSLVGRLVNTGDASVVKNFTVSDSGNMNWKESAVTDQEYSVRIGNVPAGEYSFQVKLSDPRSGSDVGIGLSDSTLDDGYYELCRLSFR